MTEELKNLREETIKQWQRKYRKEIDSCLNEAKAYAISNPTALKCIIKRKNTSEKFKIALGESSRTKEGFAIVFRAFGKIEVWFDEVDYMAHYFS